MLSAKVRILGWSGMLLALFACASCGQQVRNIEATIGDQPRPRDIKQEFGIDPSAEEINFEGERWWGRFGPEGFWGWRPYSWSFYLTNRTGKTINPPTTDSYDSEGRANGYILVSPDRRTVEVKLITREWEDESGKKMGSKPHPLNGIYQLHEFVKKP
jgi:hypothetical protein